MPRDSSDEQRTVAWPDNTVWLASYPRSGNTYLRAVLWACFGLQTGSVYPDDLLGDLAVSRQVGHFEGAAHRQFSADFLRLPLVKTHEWPVDDRKAIYVVRDGRDCCRSLREFLRASGYEVDLDAIIAGQHHFGSWSSHFLAWDPAARPNTLFLRFEQLTEDFDGTLERLATFLEMRPLHATPPKLVAARGVGPHWLSPGSTRGKAMTSTQEALFDRLHGHVMARLGYPTAPEAVKRTWATALVARTENRLPAFPLFTSIKPPASADELTYLRECLNSWRVAGFDAVAVNGPGEIGQLQGLDLHVEFFPLPNDRKPRISAILSAIRKSGARFAGIINGDCRIIGYPDLATSLRAGLDQSCILAWRVDICEGIKPAATSHGFDAYFFDTRFIPEDDAGFSIGDPWWDYWFPLACEMRGARLETLNIPLLTHRVHPVNWKRRNWEGGARRFWTALRGWRPDATAPQAIFGRIPVSWWRQEELTASRVAKLSLIAPSWFHQGRPQTIAVLPHEMAEIETTLRMTARALLDEAELVLAKNVLMRIIGPLRIVVAVFRRARHVVLGRLQLANPKVWTQ